MFMKGCPAQRKPSGHFLLQFYYVFPGFLDLVVLGPQIESESKIENSFVWGWLKQA